MAPKTSDEGHAPNPPSRKALLWQVSGAALAAIAIGVLFVLPAERGVDLTGFGRATGLVKLAAPAPAQEVKVEAPKAGVPLHHSYGTTFRTDEIDIPLGSGGRPGARSCRSSGPWYSAQSRARPLPSTGSSTRMPRPASASSSGSVAGSPGRAA